MDIKKIKQAALQRLDISQFTGAADYVTIRPLSRTALQECQQARTTGIDMDKLTAALIAEGVTDFTDPKEQQRIVAKYPGIIDPDRLDNGKRYALAVMSNGLDATAHTLVENDQPVVITADYLAELWDYYPELVDYLVQRIEILTAEYSIKKNLMTAGSGQ